MVYELRIYHMNPGKMGTMLKRFDEQMFDLLAKHGIKVVDFFTDAAGNEKVYYICEFENLEAKDTAWKSIFTDPELFEIKDKYDADGEIMKSYESYTMERNDFFRR